MRLLASLFALLLIVPAHAELTAANVGVLVNKNDPDSARVAAHYCQMRGVPEANVLTVDVPAGETLSRAIYEDKLVPAVRQWMSENGRMNSIYCLLLAYGMPLRVGPRMVTEADKKEIAELQGPADEAKKKLDDANARIKQLDGTKPRTKEQDDELANLRKQVPQLQQDAEVKRQKLARAKGDETVASLDSELALLFWPKYELYRWVPNFLYFGCPPATRQKVPRIMLSARLDGPTPECAMRLVDDAMAAEKNGLQGVVYVDSRGIKQNKEHPDVTGYAGYDESLRELAEVLKTQTKLEVVHDDKPELFAPGACKRCMLYCGWYSLAKYVDSFEFVQGAVGYHIASAEATTLRNRNSNVWCEKMLEHGIAATLGPVGEPYTLGFPKPYEFFVILLSGKATLAETYFATEYLNSWMTTLIGDPLYNPFKAHPLLALDQLRFSPKGTRIQF